ncbi:MAG TPA: ectoine hydroxylase [Pseudomonadales bacterium]
MIRRDPYPTRLEHRSDPIPRREPVVHGGAGRDGPLTAQHLAQFERDGFLVLDGFFRPREVRGFLEDLEAYGRDPALCERPQVIREADSGAIRSIFAIHRLSGRFDALVRDSRLLELAGQILDGDVYVHQSRLNRKPAFRGRGFAWHSDFETWHAEDGMPAMRCISISVSLTENNDLNGPLLLIPGSHRTFYPTVGATPERYWERSLQQQRIGVPDVEDLAASVRDGGIVTARGGPGTVTVFDCNTLHGSTDNLSAMPRSNLFFVYNSVENRLQQPFAAAEPRPEWVASREHVEPLEPLRSQRSAVA